MENKYNKDYEKMIEVLTIIIKDYMKNKEQLKED